MAAVKKPIRDYAPEIEREPPEYLREWAAKGTRKNELMLYKSGRYLDPMTEEYENVADCHCTACGADFRYPRISGYVCSGHASEMGFLDSEYKECRSGSGTTCPECGTKVRAAHIIGTRTAYGDEYAYPLTLQRIDGWGETDRLALVVWQVCCWYSWEGTRHETIRLYEAFVAEEKKLFRVTAHVEGFAGTDNFIWPKQVTRTTETMRDISDIVVPDWSIVEGTTCENAKLEIYLTGAQRPVFPAAYLKLWQTRKNVETLLTCGAGDILNELIRREKSQRGRCSYQAWNTLFPKLRELNWKAKRPADILRLDGRGELREAVRVQTETPVIGDCWKLLLDARAEGRGWTLGDLKAAQELGLDKLPPEDEPRPEILAKYLRAQKRRHPEGQTDLAMLRDYRNLRKNVPEELRGVEWPENLRREHDLAVMRQKTEVHKKLVEGFQKRETQLSRYAYESGGILIRPPHDEAELIAEGKILNHCVATYAERHASGETAILLIRHADDPEMPWYTLNLNEKDLTVIQNRGMRNCARTAEVSAFEKEWLGWVQAGCPKRKEKESA